MSIVIVLLPVIFIALGIGFVGGWESGYARGRTDERDKCERWFSRRDRIK